jgi:hypothetical protein
MPRTAHLRRDRGRRPEDAGAAGGVVDVAHQIGGSFGFAVLVAVFAAAAHSFAHAFTGAAVLLALALIVVR